MLFTLAVTFVTLDPIAVATSDNAVPPVVIVITSEPENASEVLPSASPLIESNDTAPILAVSYTHLTLPTTPYV